MVTEAIQDMNKSEASLGLVLGIVNSNDTTTVRLGGGKVKADITNAELNAGLFNPIKPEDVRPGALFFGFSLPLGNTPTDGLKIDLASIVPDNESRLISTLQAVDTTTRTLMVIDQQINLTNNTTIMVRDGGNIKNGQLSELKPNKPISVSVEVRGEQLIATRILQDINANLDSSDALLRHLSLRSWARSLSLMAPNPTNNVK